MSIAAKVEDLETATGSAWTAAHVSTGRAHMRDKQQGAEYVRPLGWWTISGEALLDMLRRCHEGESPGAVYAEEYANSEHNDGRDGA